MGGNEIEVLTIQEEQNKKRGSSCKMCKDEKIFFFTITPKFRENILYKQMQILDIQMVMRSNFSFE